MDPELTLGQLYLLGGLFLWQSAESIVDFRDRRIPLWFSLVPLTGGLLYLAGSASLPAALWMLTSIAATEIRSRWGGLFVLLPALCSAIVWPAGLVLPLVWVLLWAAWVKNLMGGADALAGTVLIVWFPTWPMAMALLSGLVAWSLAVLLVRDGRRAILRLWLVSQSGLPAPDAPGDGRFPGLPAFPLALALFAFYHWAGLGLRFLP